MAGLDAIETTFVNQYSTNVLYLASQEMSKLRGTVINDSVQGEEKFWDQYGTVDVLERITRFGDSPINVTPRESRRLALYAYESGEPVDSFDRVKTLNDPASPIVRRHAQAFARQYDKTIVDALLGTAQVGRKTLTPTALPAGQTVAVNDHDFDSGTGNVGLTVGKLIAARNILGNNDVESDTYHIAVTQTQLSNLLAEDKATSSDYAAIKALVNGEINSFMGFTFHRISTSILPVDSNNYRRVVAYTPDAGVLGVGEDVQAFIDRRADKSFNWYAYMSMFIGATRVEESKVVEILCLES
jgi:hypothetical protein